MLTLKELSELGVGFVSLTEALDLTTPTGRALAGLLAIFAEFERELLRERVKAASHTHAKKDDLMAVHPPPDDRLLGSNACMQGG